MPLYKHSGLATLSYSGMQAFLARYTHLPNGPKTDPGPKKQMDPKKLTLAMAILFEPPSLPPGKKDKCLLIDTSVLSSEYTKTRKERVIVSL